MTTDKSVPKAMRPIYEAIVAITDEVAKEHLDEEYADMARRLAAALARKRPSPLVSGRLDVWACAIMYVVGSVNFLFDKTQTPHMTGEELCEAFGVSKSTCSQRAGSIRKMLGIYQGDPRWTLPSMIDENPLVWMIRVNGLIVDARDLPRPIQEEAFRRGLISYVPE